EAGIPCATSGGLIRRYHPRESASRAFREPHVRPAPQPARSNRRRNRMPEQLRRRRILIAALAGAGLAALGITVASSHAAPDRNGRIAFTHRSFTHECCQEIDDVMTIEPDGSDPRRLTNTAPGGGSEGPAWAAHGNRILFDSDRADGRSHLFSMNGNGNGVTQLTHGAGNEAL